MSLLPAYNVVLESHVVSTRRQSLVVVRHGAGSPSTIALFHSAHDLRAICGCPTHALPFAIGLQVMSVIMLASRPWPHAQSKEPLIVLAVLESDTDDVGRRAGATLAASGGFNAVGFYTVVQVEREWRLMDCALGTMLLLGVGLVRPPLSRATISLSGLLVNEGVKILHGTGTGSVGQRFKYNKVICVGVSFAQSSARYRLNGMLQQLCTPRMWWDRWCGDLGSVTRKAENEGEIN
ncbi:hypothetical protein BKA70DRAFT_1409720 [Coprinopsis sp. MPI-PUGE-AT-0042]|nr:hypothetical protein BKA70DRAFT_1409720 [Coprinopsis sp. MPI-PUGE-AT-0042]